MLMKFQILLLACSIIIASCSDNSKKISYYETMQAGLMNTRTIIDISNNTILHNLEDKSKDIVYKDHTNKWLPIAEQAKTASDSLISNIENVITDFKVRAGIIEKDAKEPDGAIDDKAVEEFFTEDKAADMLNKKIENYINVLIGLDRDMAKDLPFSIINKINNNIITSTTAFETVLLLQALRNNVGSIENMVLDYCNRKCYAIIETYDVFNAIISQNSTYVKAGDSIEINAGIGAFTKVAQPVITIDNKKIEVNYDAVAVYRTVASNVPGTHTIRVIIKYTKPDGEKSEIYRDVKYVVVE